MTSRVQMQTWLARRAARPPVARDLFQPGTAVLTRAPGRLDLMGGIADYSGSLVLQWPLAEATWVALQPRADRRLRVVSLDGGSLRAPGFELLLDDLWQASGAHGAAPLRQLLGEEDTHWGAYVAGVYWVLHRAGVIPSPSGADVLIASQVPEAKGVSSSAALEVAVMRAVLAAAGVQRSARDVALLCQQVENDAVGAPCGVMDQMVAATGEAGKLMALRCQPAELVDPLPLPPSLTVWGLDSGVRHAVSGADYTGVRTGAFMGYRIIAGSCGATVKPAAAGRVELIEPRFGGYLANVTPTEWAAEFRDHVPEVMPGAEFLERFGGTPDRVTTVEAARSYAVRTPTAHPIHEHARVQRFAELLASFSPRAGEELGELMFASHQSYSACGLGSAATDLLVDLVRAEGPARGLYGAKITGGGCGGTVAVLGRADSTETLRRVTRRFAQHSGYDPQVFAGTSAGAFAAGVEQVECA